MLQKIACWTMIATVLTSVVQADSGAGMLYARGTVWLNGHPFPSSSAILPGDSIETRADSVANINAAGASVIIQPASSVKFEANAVALDHGNISIGTSSQMIARTKQVTATPVTRAWTEFEMMLQNGSVKIADHKGDVSVNCGRETEILSAGEQIVVDDSGACRKRKPGGAPPPGGSSPAKWYAIGGGVVAGVLGCLLWLCDDDAPSISKWKP